MDLLGLAELAAVDTLRDGAALLLDLNQGPGVVVARRRPMTCTAVFLPPFFIALSTLLSSLLALIGM